MNEKTARLLLRLSGAILGGILRMQIDLTASHDACQLLACCQNEDEEVHGFRLSHVVQGRSRSWNWKTLRNFPVSIGSAAFLATALGVVTTEPAVAAQPLAVPAANSSSNPCRTPSAIEHHYSATPDPLETITVSPAVDLTDYVALQRQIIVSLPLTVPPVSEGEDDEDQISLASKDYVDFEEMRVPRWIVDTVLRASEVTDADPVYMMALADKESSFIPANKATTSSAEGLFQFIASTWLEAVRSFGPKHGLLAEAKAIEIVNGKPAVQDEAMREHILGLRRNPYISALMAAEMMKRDKAKIEGKLGRKLSQSEFYLSHFFGVDSASKFIALVDDTPQKSAPDAFPAAAKANKSLFFAKTGNKTRQLSVAEVYGKIDSMIDKRLDRYSDVSMRSADASF